MRNRFMTGLIVILLGITFGVSAPATEKKLLPEPETDEGGMYVQSWFHDSFLDLREDAAEAKDAGKQLAIMWEQRGCPYCREMHRVNLRVPEIVDYIKTNFTVIQLNLWGDREVTDFDGQVTTEKKLARKYRVQFTPTIQFFPTEISKGGKTPGQDEEVWRLMGYWKPFHFLNSFVYVHDKAYVEQPNFQRWLQAHAEKLEAEGKEVKLW
jgi:thioredoxin-related protein